MQTDPVNANALAGIRPTFDLARHGSAEKVLVEVESSRYATLLLVERAAEGMRARPIEQGRYQAATRGRRGCCGEGWCDVLKATGSASPTTGWPAAANQLGGSGGAVNHGKESDAELYPFGSSLPGTGRGEARFAPTSPTLATPDDCWPLDSLARRRQSWLGAPALPAAPTVHHALRLGLEGQAKVV